MPVNERPSIGALIFPPSGYNQLCIMHNAPGVEDQETEALRRRLAELEMISAFHEEAGRILGPNPSPTALQELLELIRVRFGIRSAAYLRVEPVAQELVPGAASPALTAKPANRRLGDGPAGQAAATGKPVRTESPEQGSSLSIPVRVSGRTVGVLDLVDVAAGRF